MKRATSSVPESVVVDASATVEALIGTPLGLSVRARLRGCELHAPAHLDAEVLSALGRLQRAGDLDVVTVARALDELVAAPVTRHPLSGLLVGTWALRDRFRLVDGLYLELANTLRAVVLTTDGRLARASSVAELVS